MKTIKQVYKDGDKTFSYEYRNVESFKELEEEPWRQIYGVCFIGDKLVIIRDGVTNTWMLPGDKPEEGENFEQALRREVKEEANMNILYWEPLGVQHYSDSEDKSYNQLRAWCIVEPFGEFEKDPGGNTEEIKPIDPKDYRQYFDWGNIGEEMIKRAIELKNKYLGNQLAS